MTRKRLISISIVATIVLSAAVTFLARPDKVVGDLNSDDVRKLQRIVRSVRARDFQPYAGATLMRKCVDRLRFTLAKIEIVERPRVIPDMAYIVYRDRLDTNRTSVYYFKTDGTNGWRFSSAQMAF